MTFDIKLFYFFNNLVGRSHTFDTLVLFLAAYLQYLLAVVFLLFLFFATYKTREKLRIFWVTVISAGIARLGVTELIRLLYHRPRPFITLHVHTLLVDNEWSFPSGHSAFFFALATAIYLYNKKWGLGFFIAAILMNISRIIAGVHYPSDILGGAIIGIVVAHVVFYFSDKVNDIISIYKNKMARKIVS